MFHEAVLDFNLIIFKYIKCIKFVNIFSICPQMNQHLIMKI